MNVCVLKLGSRICVNSRSTSGGNGETLAIIKLLTTAGINVTAFTKILDKDEVPADFQIKDILKEEVKSEDYDCLLVLNGNANYFGGQDSPSDTKIYEVINNFKGKVFYILCDPNLTLTQVWPSIEKKEWKDTYTKEDVLIQRDDIIYICQPKDVVKYKEHVKKSKIQIKDVIHFPFEKFPLVTMKKDFLNPEECSWDIIYGGTFRSGRREEDMIKFYFGYPEDIKVNMFGKIEEKHFKKNKQGLNMPMFGKAIPYENFNQEMKSGLSTVIIGDALYKQVDDLAQRTYESILCGNVTFIDDSYDKSKRVFTNETLRKFCYVSSRDDVIKKIRFLRENPKHIALIQSLQYTDVMIDINQYCKDFRKIIEENF
jgi:hypothetical protein